MLLKRCLLLLLPFCWSIAEISQADEPLQVCLISGSLEYKSNESLAEFQTYLETNYNVTCSRAFMEGTDDTHLPRLEHLDDCDVALLFTRRLKLQDEELERFQRYALSGKPLVGVRTASHALQTWLALDKEVLGGNYQGHYGDGELTEVHLVAEAADHPILAGVSPWKSTGSLYKNPDLATDVQVLLTGSLPDGRTEPIAWTRPYKGGRIFYTSLGHPADFEQESFRRMLVNALFWTCDQMPVVNSGAL